MGALNNLSHQAVPRKSPINKFGVLTIHGYGVSVRVQSRHLTIEHGVGPDRHTIRLARVGHNLKRVVCISEDGFVTLSALKWLSDIGVPLVMLDRMGKVLFVTGPTASSDSRIRQSQSLALGNGTALAISKELISAKLIGQENLARHTLKKIDLADVIAKFREKLPDAENLDAVRILEAHAAVASWSAWRDVPVLWLKSDLAKVPAHWLKFGTRASPLTGNPRLAVNPPNAILNYCLALAESETRSALVSLGLDPGIGFLHFLRPNRDSLVFDVMEPLRSEIEHWLFRWVSTEPLRRSDFYESANGNCRLMSGLCSQLSGTAPTWAKLVAPWAEYVAQTLWSSTSGAKRSRKLATPLTQQHRREAKGQPPLPSIAMLKPDHVCRGCGTRISRGKECPKCRVTTTRENFDAGRRAALRPEFIAKRAETQRKRWEAIHNWNPSELPSWLTRDVYLKEIQPKLAGIPKALIRSVLGVSEPYALYLQTGKYVPHARHWQALAQLVEKLESGAAVS